MRHLRNDYIYRGGRFFCRYSPFPAGQREGGAEAPQVKMVTTNNVGYSVTVTPPQGSGHAALPAAWQLQMAGEMKTANMVPPADIIADGRFHRFDPYGGRGDNGWYVVHQHRYSTRWSFGDWRNSDSKRTGQTELSCSLSPEERAAYQKEMREHQAAVEREQLRIYTEAAEEARARCRRLRPASAANPYLKKKQIEPCGVLRDRENLVIPRTSIDDGKVWSWQEISPDGFKYNQPGGRQGRCYFRIGTSNAAFVICEGFATGATLAMVPWDTLGEHLPGSPSVMVAGTAGNLLCIAEGVRAQFPNTPIVVAADDDWLTNGNPGLAAATKAARAVGGILIKPQFHSSGRPRWATDFNDQHTLHGIDEVRTTIEQALAQCQEEQKNGAICAEGSEKPSDPRCDGELPEPDNDEVLPADDDNKPLGHDGFPTEAQRPCFRVFDTLMKVGEERFRPGVWYFGIKPATRNNPPQLVNQWISSPIYIDAVSHDGADNNFGRCLRFRNTNKRWRTWAMPMELLAGDGTELRAELLSMGVKIDPYGKQLLANYLQNREPKRRMLAAMQVGWHGESFVLPDAAIGPGAEDVIFQSGERGREEYARGGTLAGWQSEIAAHAAGNPMLALAISSAFAGPLIAPCLTEGGGIHLVGDSSTGKTTAVEAACSVWGGSKHKRSWRATANGLEGAAVLFNDNMLSLDEIGECLAKEIDAIVYMLTNGAGKQRASRTGSARGVQHWCCFILSSGEKTVSTAMLEGGIRAKAGQMVRLLDVPVQRKFGIFDDLQQFQSGQALSDHLKRAATRHHGHAGRAFLERLTRDKSDMAERLDRIKRMKEFKADGDASQDGRAAGRFALVALAGELAIEYGIVPWPEGTAVKAAAVGLAAWRSLRGGSGNDEPRQILERVNAFIQRHGDSRFSNKANVGDVVRDRAGWWEDDAARGRVYLFTSDGLKEAVKGFELSRALDSLQAAGALVTPNESGERRVVRQIGNGKPKLYAVAADNLEGSVK